ncbi:hypothetical protein AB1278_00155 [Chryseobacterium sp. NRRL B-14798]|uniref:hypothetical protein n=1 Tax=Chryseobacterium sp. NRRL B-14798 TaxID=3162880 RepID=UPI003D250621
MKEFGLLLNPMKLTKHIQTRKETVGKLYSTTRINSEKGNRVLELLYCDNCGTTLFGGSRLVTRNKSGNNSFEMLQLALILKVFPEKHLQNWLKKEVIRSMLSFGQVAINNSHYTMQHKVFLKIIGDNQL